MERFPLKLHYKRLEVPKAYRDEFYRGVLKSNADRLCIAAVIMAVAQALLVIFRGSVYGMGDQALPFLIGSAVIIPLLLYARQRHQTVSFIFARAVVYGCCAWALLFGEFVALTAYAKLDLIHIYLLLVFGIASFIYMRPAAFLVLLAATYAVFFTALPRYNGDAAVIALVRANALVCNLFAFVINIFMIRAAKKAFLNKRMLRDMARQDRMTGLLNHEECFNILKRELAVANSNKRPLSLLLFDIDDFKAVNDTYGHLAGDAVIKAVADTLKRTVRSTDIMGRFGGDEFMIILPDTGLEAAQTLASRICETIKSADLYPGLNVTLSCGISQYEGQPLDEFITLTDNRLYNYKRRGKYIDKQSDVFLMLRCS